MKRIIITLGLIFMIVGVVTPLPRTIAQPTTPSTVVSRSPTVRVVAAHPAAYLGHLTLSGVVGLVTAGKGFVLVDMKEYEEEGFGCLTTDEPTKIPVEWAGATPKVREKVRVSGTLKKEKKGYAYIAKKVAKL